MIWYKPISCDSCGQIHKVTLNSRFRVSIAVVGLPMAIRLLLFEDSNLLGYLMFAIPMVFLLPYIMRYR